MIAIKNNLDYFLFEGPERLFKKGKNRVFTLRVANFSARAGKKPKNSYSKNKLVGIKSQPHCPPTPISEGLLKEFTEYIEKPSCKKKYLNSIHPTQTHLFKAQKNFLLKC